MFTDYFSTENIANPAEEVAGDCSTTPMLTIGVPSAGSSK